MLTIGDGDNRHNAEDTIVSTATLKRHISRRAPDLPILNINIFGFIFDDTDADIQMIPAVNKDVRVTLRLVQFGTGAVYEAWGVVVGPRSDVL